MSEPAETAEVARAGFPQLPLLRVAAFPVGKWLPLLQVGAIPVGKWLDLLPFRVVPGAIHLWIYDPLIFDAY